MIQKIDHKIVLTFDNHYVSEYEDILHIKDAIKWAISHIIEDSIDNETIFWLSYLDKELTPLPKQVNLNIKPG